MKTAAIKVGPLSIHWFGVIITIALIAGLLISVGMARLRGQRTDHLAGILLLGLFAGMIGARIWFFVFRRDFYTPDPGRIFAVWEGGLALQGALVGAILATVIYTWSKELDFWLWADICAPGLILGQAIGRIGDLLNNQAFGAPTTGKWAVIIPLSNRPPQFQAFSHFQPIAAYEGAWDAGVFILLVGLTLLGGRGSRVLPVGSVFLAYLVLYSIGRIPLENLRLDSLWVMNMRVAQLASGIFIALGVLGYLARLLDARGQKPIAVPEPQLQPTQAYLIAASRGNQSRTAAIPAAGVASLPPPYRQAGTPLENRRAATTEVYALPETGLHEQGLAAPVTGTLAGAPKPPTEEAS